MSFTDVPAVKLVVGGGDDAVQSRLLDELHEGLDVGG